MAKKKTVTIEQIGSIHGRVKNQRACLKGLGLGRRHRVVSLEDTPSVRGMIKKVSHLITIKEGV